MGIYTVYELIRSLVKLIERNKRDSAAAGMNTQSQLTLERFGKLPPGNHCQESFSSRLLTAQSRKYRLISVW